MNYDNTIAWYGTQYETTKYGLMPLDLARACEFWDFLIPQLNPGQSVIDCSAGRGILLKLVQPYGIRCVATEAVPYLVTHDLASYEPRYLRYDQLATLQPEKYDAVVSMCVLDNLETQDEVRAALRDMVALSNMWLCICIDLVPPQWVDADGAIIEPHRRKEPPDWWHNEVAQVANVLRTHQHYSSFFVFAQV